MIKTNYKILFLAIICLTNVRMQLNRCPETYKLLNSSKFSLQSFINTRIFNQNEIPTEVPGLDYIGGGANGKAFKLDVYSLAEYDEDNQILTEPRKLKVALKVTKFDQVTKADTDNEMMVLQTISSSYPLYLLQFYGCGSNGVSRALVLTERLDYDLFSNKFATRKSMMNTQLKVELALMMAIAVKKLHIEGYGHFDIKPHNIMFKEGTYL